MEENKNTEQEVLTAEDAKALAPLYTDVIKALKQVYDPEIPVNIYDLGLIYELVINKEHDVAIKMTFTAPNCPMADEVMAEVKTSVEDVPGIKSCNVNSFSCAINERGNNNNAINMCLIFIKTSFLFISE